MERKVPDSAILADLMQKIEAPKNPLRFEPIITVKLKDQVLSEPTNNFTLNCGENVRRPSSVYVMFIPTVRTIEDASTAFDKVCAFSERERMF